MTAAETVRANQSSHSGKIAGDAAWLDHLSGKGPARKFYCRVGMHLYVLRGDVGCKPWGRQLAFSTREGISSVSNTGGSAYRAAQCRLSTDFPLQRHFAFDIDLFCRSPGALGGLF
jgi:hypothetical protein